MTHPGARSFQAGCAPKAPAITPRRASPTRARPAPRPPRPAAAGWPAGSAAPPATAPPRRSAEPIRRPAEPHRRSARAPRGAGTAGSASDAARAGGVSRTPRRRSVRPSQASITARVRSQRRPLISSSYSSASRRRARNSVLSTTGRDIPSRSPISPYDSPSSSRRTRIRWWSSDTPRNAPRRSSSSCLLSTAASGPGALENRSSAVVRGLPLLLERDLVAAPSATKLVDAGVLRDPVDPRLEHDRPLGVPQPAQNRDEHLLGDVLGPVGIADDAAHIGADPAAIARRTAPRTRCPHRAGPPSRARGRSATKFEGPLEAAVP